MLVFFVVLILLTVTRSITFPAFSRIELVLSQFSKHKKLAIVTVFFTTFLFCGLYAMVMGIPVPKIHDEYSYLLQADTFSKGRLANPSHPCSVNFDTFHVLQHPTYASKYPPAQGVVLALGKIIDNTPIIGVWLSVAAACAGICWMLQAWVGPGWAVCGAYIAFLQVMISKDAYWSQSYWGGAVAAFGGALIFGAARRLISNITIRHSIILGAGIAILACSRPYEGVLIILPLLTLVCILLIKSEETWHNILLKFFTPLFVVLIATASSMLIYNKAITNNYFELPYIEYARQHDGVPNFVFEKFVRQPQLYNSEMLKLFKITYSEYLKEQTITGFIASISDKTIKYSNFYFGFVLLIPFIIFRRILREPPLQACLLIFLFFGAGLMVCTYQQNHYAAPATGLIYIIIVSLMSHLYEINLLNFLSGKTITRAIVISLIFFAALDFNYQMEFNKKFIPWQKMRVILSESLSKIPGKHLVLVKYSQRHSPHAEWVYNGADIDDSKIVWARYLDKQKNGALTHYFFDRYIWVLSPDAPKLELKCYGKGSLAN